MFIAVTLLLLAAVLRLWDLGTLPPGFSDQEIGVLSITRQTQLGQIVVFASDHGEGQETLFHVLQATVTGLAGDGLITLRLPAVAIGLLTLAALFVLARRLHGTRVALLAVALMAVGFWPVLLSRLSLREVLVPFFTVAILLALVNAFHIRREVSPDPPTTIAFTALGLTMAVSLYAHWLGLWLAAGVTAIVAYLFLSRQHISRRAAGASSFAILISLILAIPYVATTLRLPALSGVSSMSAAMSPANLLQAIFEGLAAIVARGDLNPAYNLPGRPLLDPVTALLLVIGLAASLRHWRQPANLIPALAALILLIPALLSTEAGSFLGFVGVLPLLYLMAALGLSAVLDWLGQRGIWHWRLGLLSAGLPIVLVAFNLLWTGVDLFGIWPAQSQVQIAYNASRGLLANHLDRTADRLPTVVCSPHLLDTEAQLSDPALLALMMQRENAPLRYVDCANGLIIAEGGAHQQFAFTDLSIQSRMYDVLRSWLYNRPTLPVAGLQPGSLLEMNVEGQLQNAIGRLLTTAPTGWAPESPGGAGSAPLPARFGGNLTFLGYAPPRDPTFAPGDVVPIITYWRADGPVPPDVRIFTHLLSDPAALVAQNQAINVSASTLHNRDVFIQVNYIVLPESVPAGDYVISIGLYRSESGERLPVYDGENERGNRLFLYAIAVVRETEAGS